VPRPEPHEIGWICVSPGPDHDYDIAGEWNVYDPSAAQLFKQVPERRDKQGRVRWPEHTSPVGPQQLVVGTNKKGSAFTYDPTNGVVSDGDIWRIKI
jgi:hypothetical protein